MGCCTLHIPRELSRFLLNALKTHVSVVHEAFFAYSGLAADYFAVVVDPLVVEFGPFLVEFGPVVVDVVEL